MALYLGALLFFGEDEEPVFELHNRVMRIARRRLRDAPDPFSISDNEFKKLYR